MDGFGGKGMINDEMLTVFGFGSTVCYEPNNEAERLWMAFLCLPLNDLH